MKAKDVAEKVAEFSDARVLRLLLGLLVEAVSFVGDGWVWEHADFAGVGCDLKCGGVADALRGEELFLRHGLRDGFDGEERGGTVEESDEVGVAGVDGGEAERHVE